MNTVYAVLGLQMMFVLLLTVGLFTPISALLAFITLQSIVTRNEAIGNGGLIFTTAIIFLSLTTFKRSFHIAQHHLWL